MLGRKSPFGQLQRAPRHAAERGPPRGRRSRERRSARSSSRRLDARRAELGAVAEEALLEADRIDVTLPGRRPRPGSLHPLTLVEREIVEVFARSGSASCEGPGDRGRLAQLPGAQHPARSPRAHDEGLAVRRDPGAPRAAAADRDHRGPDPHDAVAAAARLHRRRRAGSIGARRADATHLPVFHQVEGLVVDEGITFAAPQGHARGDREGAVRGAAPRCGSGPRTSRSSSRAPRSG